MMNVKDNKVIGSLFYFYRKMKKISRKEISLISKEKNIFLSESTIKRIEIENINNNDVSLRKYTKLLSLYYEKDEYPYNKLDSYKTRTLKLINSGPKLKELEVLCEELNGFHAYYKKYIFLEEISKLLINLLEDYLFNKKINSDEQRLYEFITKCNDDDDENEIIASMHYLLYRSYLFERGNSNENLHKIKEILANINFNNFLHYKQAKFEINDNNLLSLYNKYNVLYRETKIKESNIFDIAISLSNLVYCEIALKEYELAKRHIEEILNMDSNEEYIPMYAIYGLYNTLGYIYFNLKQYKKAFKSFDFSRKQGGNSINFNFLLMLISAEKIDATNYSKNIIEEELNEVKLPVVKNILIYFKLKYECEDKKDSEEFIVKHLNKKELLFEIYNDLIFNELYQLVKETKHYKYLYDYLKVSEIE